MASTTDTRTTGEIYQEATRVNDQVTDGLRNALRIVDDTRDVQATTLSEMKKQGDQLEEIQEALEDVQEDTKYAQAVLDDIGCLCWCFGRKKSKNLQRPIHRPAYKPEPRPVTSSSPPANEIQMMTRTNAVQESQKPKTATAANSANTAEDMALHRIEEGKKEQDNLMDQISSGLDVLKHGAKAMGEELARQDEIIDKTEKQTDDVTRDTKDTVRHSAFRRHVGGLS